MDIGVSQRPCKQCEQREHIINNLRIRAPPPPPNLQFLKDKKILRKFLVLFREAQFESYVVQYNSH